MFLAAFGTDGVTELGLRIGGNEYLHALPVAGVVADFFAIRANRQQAPKNLRFLLCTLPRDGERSRQPNHETRNEAVEEPDPMDAGGVKEESSDREHRAADRRGHHERRVMFGGPQRHPRNRRDIEHANRNVSGDQDIENKDAQDEAEV
ncbi:MAG: hypothetical protein K0S58_3557 [Nitrospira sp.]|nr:hypothetical protein [Nitrospira sp.]